MSAFEDYCIVCEKICEEGSAYCSEECKHVDLKNSDSPTLSVCSGLPSVSGSFSLQHSNSNSCSRSHSNSISYPHTMTSTIPTIISPLLTPQVVPRNCSTVGSVVKSPNLKDLTYESPLLATSSHSINNTLMNDLDSNRLDLNNSSIGKKHSITQRLSQSLHKKKTSDAGSKPLDPPTALANDNPNNHKKITNVSNLLHSSSENYKKWLSIH